MAGRPYCRVSGHQSPLCQLTLAFENGNRQLTLELGYKLRSAQMQSHRPLGVRSLDAPSPQRNCIFIEIDICFADSKDLRQGRRFRMLGIVEEEGAKRWLSRSAVEVCVASLHFASSSPFIKISFSVTLSHLPLPLDLFQTPSPSMNELKPSYCSLWNLHHNNV